MGRHCELLSCCALQSYDLYSCLRHQHFAASVVNALNLPSSYIVIRCNRPYDKIKEAGFSYKSSKGTAWKDTKAKHNQAASNELMVQPGCVHFLRARMSVQYSRELCLRGLFKDSVVTLMMHRIGLRHVAG